MQQKEFFTILINRNFQKCPVHIHEKRFRLWFVWASMLLLITLLPGCMKKDGSGTVKVLILTGQNNHEWERTTAVLRGMYKKSPLFEVSVTEQPDTLAYVDLIQYDVFISNWNNWPENELLWNSEQEEGFLRYLEAGGGAVFLHAGASSYYQSGIYHRISIGRWGAQTAHGQPLRALVARLDPVHPVMEGINDFYILDEIWEKPDIHPEAQAIARLTATDESDGQTISEDAVFTNRIGKGRSFYTILGHDERALFNTGLQTLLLRGTEWAARGEVTIEVPQDLKMKPDSGNPDYRWDQSDTSIQLTQNDAIVWRYNFRNRFGKTYFHPLYLNNNRLTCESPADHTWHPGLWFSWKFINGVNYWEYKDEYKSEATGFKSEGITEPRDIRIRKNPDYSADIDLLLIYYPEGKNPVLEETRKIFVSPPDEQGGYYIDYQHEFQAVYGDVLLDRTPITGEPEGKSWGGYGGLTIRFNQDFTEADCIPDVETPDYPKGPWFYMGFDALTGERSGIGMFQHPDYTTPYTRWYYATDRSTPFFFFTPAALYDRPINLKKGESLELRYRVWVLGNTTNELLDKKFEEYLNK